MQHRTRRMLVYTLALLMGFIPMMPFERGTRAFALAGLVSGAIIAAAGIYVIRGERDARWRPMWARKLLAAAWVTTIAAVILLAIAVYGLLR